MKTTAGRMVELAIQQSPRPLLPSQRGKGFLGKAGQGALPGGDEDRQDVICRASAAVQVAVNHGGDRLDFRPKFLSRSSRGIEERRGMVNHGNFSVRLHQQLPNCSSSQKPNEDINYRHAVSSETKHRGHVTNYEQTNEQRKKRPTLTCSMRKRLWRSSYVMRLMARPRCPNLPERPMRCR